MKRMQSRSLLFVALCGVMGLVHVGSPANAAELPDLRLDVASGHFQGVLGWSGRDDAEPVWVSEGQATAGVPHSPDVAWPVASVTKAVTAVAVLRMVEQGRLSLDDRLDRHWPEAKGYPAGSVTILQLLNHRSGIPSVLRTEQGLDETLDPSTWHLPTTQREQIALVLSKPLLFEPGSRYSYNNSAYMMLGEMLGHLTGMPADRAVLTLGLGSAERARQACICADLPGVPDVDLMQYAAAGGVERAPLTHPGRMGAAGGMRITARALLAWGQDLLAGRILRPETLAMMWQEGEATRTAGSTMGLGWVVRSGQGLVSHDGTMAGATSALVINRTTGRVAVGMISPTLDMEHISHSEDYINGRTTALALGQPFKALPALGTQTMDGLAGHYRLADGGSLLVTATDDGWKVRWPGGSPLVLPQTVRLDGESVERARHWADIWMRQGQEALKAHMSDNLAKGLPAGALDAHGQTFVQAHGAYRGNYAFRRSASGMTVQLRLLFEKGHVDLGLIADENGDLDGLAMVGEARDDLPEAVQALLTDTGALWVNGYRHGMDAVILRPRLVDGQVSGLWIGSQDIDGAFVPKMDVHDREP